MRTLIWDFDGTLGYREGGMFGAALLEVVRQTAPGADVTQGQIRPYLQSGFPWHTPERPHLEIASSEPWRVWGSMPHGRGLWPVRPEPSTPTLRDGACSTTSSQRSKSWPRAAGNT